MPPIEPRWSLAVIAEFFGVTAGYIRDVLSEHREQFRTPPEYQRDGHHPRRLRVLSAREIQTLAEIMGRAARVTKSSPFLRRPHTSGSRIGKASRP